MTGTYNNFKGKEVNLKIQGLRFKSDKLITFNRGTSCSIWETPLEHSSRNGYELR